MMGTQKPHLTDEEIKIFLEHMQSVRNEIMRHLAENSRIGLDTTGKIPCSICERGEVNWSYAGYNGHITAKCSTDNCVNWIE